MIIKPLVAKKWIAVSFCLLWVETTHSRQKLPKGAQEIAEKGIAKANALTE